MGVDYNYNNGSAYIDGAAKGQYKRWFSRRKRYTGLGALERRSLVAGTGNKALWIILILILPVIGMVLYFLIGKKK